MSAIGCALQAVRPHGGRLLVGVASLRDGGAQEAVLCDGRAGLHLAGLQRRAPLRATRCYQGHPRRGGAPLGLLVDLPVSAPRLRAGRAGARGGARRSARRSRRAAGGRGRRQGGLQLRLGIGPGRDRTSWGSSGCFVLPEGGEGGRRRVRYLYALSLSRSLSSLSHAAHTCTCSCTRTCTCTCACGVHRCHDSRVDPQYVPHQPTNLKNLYSVCTPQYGFTPPPPAPARGTVSWGLGLVPDITEKRRHNHSVNSVTGPTALERVWHQSTIKRAYFVLTAQDKGWLRALPARRPRRRRGTID